MAERPGGLHFAQCPLRLAARTPGSQPGYRGSIPLGGVIFCIDAPFACTGLRGTLVCTREVMAANGIMKAFRFNDTDVCLSSLTQRAYRAADCELLVCVHPDNHAQALRTYADDPRSFSGLRFAGNR